MTPVLYLYRSCTSSRNAAKVLDNAGVAYTAREYFKEPFTAAELQNVLDRSGLDPSELVATRSTPWRKGGLADKKLSQEELFEHMLTEPRLVRRPILMTDTEVIIGFDRERYEAIANQLAG